MADKQSTATHGFVQTQSGRIHYLEQGDGPPLILLHSNGCSAHEYEHVLPILSKIYRVIAWDMPGHGDSDPLTTHRSIEDYADAVVHLMDALDIKTAHVAGSSVGGTICVDLGVRYRDRFDWLFLVETPIRSLEVWEETWDGIDFNFGVSTQAFDVVAKRFRNLTPEKHARWNVDRNKASAKTTVGVMWALRDYDILHNLAKMEGNVAVIYGSAGPTSAGAAHFERLLPDAPSVSLPDCGHFPMFDDPEAFSDAIDGILTREAAGERTTS